MLLSMTTPPIPKYFQVQEILRQRVLDLSEGDQIPTESELCQIFNVSRITIRKAIEGLVQEGLLVTIQGKGTYVARPKFSEKPRERFVNQISGFYGDMTSRGYQVKTQVLEQSLVFPDNVLLEKLRVTPEQRIIKIVRLRFVNEFPHHIVTTFLPHNLFAGVEKANLQQGSLYALLREKYSAQLASARFVVEASTCNEIESQLLDYPLAAPILVVYSQVFDPGGNPIVYGFSRLRADQSQMEFEVLTPLAIENNKFVGNHHE
jgi:GntR family transcriptional regulator